MRLIIGTTLAFGLLSTASAQEITIQPGEWKVSSSINGDLDAGGSKSQLPPEYETESECWTQADQLTLSPDLLKVDNCNITDTQLIDNVITFNMSCNSDGVAMAGDGRIVTNSEKDMFSATMSLQTDIPGASIDVKGTMMGARMRSCSR